MLCANNKITDQPVHPHSMISPFFILFMESIVVSLAPFKNFNVQLVSVAEKTGLSLTLLETPKAGRLTSRPISGEIFLISL